MAPAYIMINAIAELSAWYFFNVTVTAQVTGVFSFAHELRWVQAFGTGEVCFKLLLDMKTDNAKITVISIIVCQRD